MGHTDVVYADPADWSVPPFSGEVRDGHLWGRGALDMKGQTAASAVALAVLARSGFVPNGDVLLIAEADEEDGVDEVGLSWLVRERPDLHCDYALNEANFRLELADGRTIYTLCVSEKMTMPVRVRARGAAGHASLPTLGDNALIKLAPVLEALAAYAPMRRSSPELDALLDVLAPGEEPRGAARARPRPAPGARARPAGPRGLHDRPDPGGRIAQAQRHPGLGRDRVRLPRAPGHRPRGAAGRIPHALAGLEVELEPSEAPLGGTRSPFDTPLRDALADWIDELSPARCSCRR